MNFLQFQRKNYEKRKTLMSQRFSIRNWQSNNIKQNHPNDSSSCKSKPFSQDEKKIIEPTKTQNI